MIFRSDSDSEFVNKHVKAYDIKRQSHTHLSKMDILTRKCVQLCKQIVLLFIQEIYHRAEDVNTAIYALNGNGAISYCSNQNELSRAIFRM